MVPRVRDKKNLGTQRISNKSRLVGAARETSKFPNWSFLTRSRRGNMAEILPIRRKTLYDQSINQLNKNKRFPWQTFGTSCKCHGSEFWKRTSRVTVRHVFHAKWSSLLLNDSELTLWNHYCSRMTNVGWFRGSLLPTNSRHHERITKYLTIFHCKETNQLPTK